MLIERPPGVLCSRVSYSNMSSNWFSSKKYSISIGYCLMRKIERDLLANCLPVGYHNNSDDEDEDDDEKTTCPILSEKEGEIYINGII